MGILQRFAKVGWRWAFPLFLLPRPSWCPFSKHTHLLYWTLLHPQIQVRLGYARYRTRLTSISLRKIFLPPAPRRLKQPRPQNRDEKLNGLYVETKLDRIRCVYVFLGILLCVIAGGRLVWGTWEIVFGAGSFLVALPMLLLTLLSHYEMWQLTVSLITIAFIARIRLRIRNYARKEHPRPTTTIH